MMVLAYILDMARVNNNKDPLKQDSLVFEMSVVFGLAGPFIQQHNQSS